MSNLDLTVIGPKVAEAFNGTIDPERERGYDAYCSIRLPDGGGLTLRHDRRGKIGISAHVAFGLHDFRDFSREPIPTINVADTSSVERIVAETRRRLYPGYLAARDAAAARKGLGESDDALRDAEAERIAELTGGKLRGGSYGNALKAHETRNVVVAEAGYLTFGVRCYEGTVRVSVDRFDDEDSAAAVAAVIAALADAHASKRALADLNAREEV